ncbi:MAG: hypothetical protein HY318_14540, partial [Armatimonadetes bacterium]|nr:hypothetical protein [Armatimonadota bacterium]
NYDWALFGEPQILLLKGNALKDRNTASGVNGVVLLDYTKSGESGELAVVATNARGEDMRDLKVSAPLSGAGLALLEFDFSKSEQATGFRVEAKNASTEALRACVYVPKLEIQHVGAAQGVCFAGKPLKLVVRIKNAGKGALMPEHNAHALFPGDKKVVINRLAPGAERTVGCEIPARDKGEMAVLVRVRWGWDETTNPERVTTRPDGTRTLAAFAVSEAKATVTVVAPLPRLPDAASRKATCRKVDGVLLLENPVVRLAFMEEGAGPLFVYARSKSAWTLVATSPGLCEVVADGSVQPTRLLRSRPEVKPNEVTFVQSFEGIPGEVRVRFGLRSGSRRATVETLFSAKGKCKLSSFRGPVLLVGDNSSGEKKHSALFPGLEYLESHEPSSSTRDLAPPLNNRLVPDPYKVTIPLMAVETEEAVVGLLWNPNQKWDGEHSLVSACFASPNCLDSQENHRLQLFIPAGSEWIGENELLARKPIEVAAGKTLTLKQELLVSPGARVLDAVDEWISMKGGLPKAEKAPRDFRAEMALSRIGFMKSAWDEKSKKSRHCVDWAPANSPGFAALLLFDSLTAKDPFEAKIARERAELIALQTVKEQGDAGLTSSACCHIMRWELPFHWGHLPGAAKAMRDQALGALGGMDEEGAWRFYPDDEHKVLGEPGAAELGTCAGPALALLRYARLTGDKLSGEMGLKALSYIDRHFKVPRGAQGWECPIHEPDILAAAYAIGAFIEAYRLTGDRLHLEQASYWARTGLPFHYLWDDPAKPGMRYASIPVFGSTFMTHSWLGLPVQWCGLVYAYHLQHLAEYDSANSASSRFPWKEVARGITVSGMYQQFDVGENEPLTGTYPDSWGNYFTRKNGAYINPEDIVVNLLALEGHDPEPKTVLLTSGESKIHVSSGAVLSAAKLSGDSVQFDASYFNGQSSYSLISGIAQPGQVSIGRRTGRPGQRLEEATTDYVYSPEMAMLFLKIRHEGKPVRVVIGGVKLAQRKQPGTRTAWEFKEDVEGWTSGHNCTVSSSEGSLVVTVTGDDPYLFSGEVNAPTAKFRRVVVRARATAGNALSLFWRSDSSPGWGEDKHVTMNLTPGGQWQDIVFDLSANPLWKGTVTQIRLDPEPAEVGPGARLEIEEIRIE